MMKKPKGRGHLSSIDTLPEWCEDAKLEALNALKERKLTQQEILDNFNGAIRLAALAIGIVEDVPQISRAAFNRKALQLAVLGRRLEETREIAKVLAPKLDQAGDNSLTLLVAETIKTLTLEMLNNAGELPADGDTAEMLMLVSRALKHAEESKRISADGRRKIETELKAMQGKKLDELATEAGLSADRVAQIRRDVLGVKS